MGTFCRSGEPVMVVLGVSKDQLSHSDGSVLLAPAHLKSISVLSIFYGTSWLVF